MSKKKKGGKSKNQKINQSEIQIRHLRKYYPNLPAGLSGMKGRLAFYLKIIIANTGDFITRDCKASAYFIGLFSG
jgi:hypothetical protein